MLERKTFAVTLLAVTSSIAGAQAAPTLDPKQLQAMVNQLMSVQVQFTQMIPPGWAIRAEDVGRSKTDAGPVVQYHLFVSGAPAGTTFRQLSWPVTQDKPQAIMDGITLGRGGILTCSGRTATDCGDVSRPDDPIEFTLTPFLPGEPFRFAFASPSGNIGIVLVPKPIQNADGGCTLEAIRLTSDFRLAYVGGTGFKPNADVHLTFGGGTQMQHADQNGTVHTAILASGPPAMMHVRVEEKFCSPAVVYQVTGQK